MPEKGLATDAEIQGALAERGITDRDLRLARQIEAAAKDQMA